MLFVISGPSGVGKGTIISQYIKTHPDFCLAISATTRPARNNEINNSDYFFISNAEFKNHIKHNDFLEWCHIHGNYYGTLKDEIEEKEKKYKAVIIEIDVNGAQKIKKHTRLAQYHIFISPPSSNILESRLKKRQTESHTDIKKRLAHAKKELHQQHLYDSIIINKELTQTCLELDNVIVNVLTTRRT